MSNIAYPNFDDLYIKTTSSKKKSQKQKKKTEEKLTEFDKLEIKKYDEIDNYINAEHSQYFGGKKLSVLLATNFLNKKIYYLRNSMSSRMRLIINTFIFSQGCPNNHYNAITDVPRNSYDIAIIVDLLEYSPSLMSMANMIKLISNSLHQEQRSRMPSAMIIFGRDMISMKKLALNDNYILTSNGYVKETRINKSRTNFLIRGFQNFKELEEMLTISRCKALPTTDNIKTLRDNFEKIDPHHAFVVGQ